MQKIDKKGLEMRKVTKQKMLQNAHRRTESGPNTNAWGKPRLLGGMGTGTQRPEHRIKHKLVPFWGLRVEYVPSENWDIEISRTGKGHGEEWIMNGRDDGRLFAGEVAKWDHSTRRYWMCVIPEGYRADYGPEGERFEFTQIPEEAMPPDDRWE